MPSTVREWALFALGAGVLVVLVALIIAQQTRSSTTNTPRGPAVSTTASPPPLSMPPATHSSEPTTAHPAASSTTTADRATLEPQARLVLTAVRGDSWLIIRASSAKGKILYEGTLTRGRALRLTGDAFWGRFGSGSNLDASLNGKPVALGTGTFDTVIKP